MKFINWTEKELVHIKAIDEQHIEIVNLLNNIHDTIGTNRTNEARSFLNEFYAKIKIHFSTEESLMKENKFTGYYSHKLEHDRFQNKLLIFNSDVQSNYQQVDLGFMKSCNKWLFNHLEINDRKCARHLQSIGIK